jgi:hypothetical protein
VVTKKKPNPEDSVIESIDALVDASLNRPITDDYNRPWTDSEQKEILCPICGDEWHGLSNNYCPGAYATPGQKGAFTKKMKAGKARRPRRRPPLSRGEAIITVTSDHRGLQREAIARAFDVPEELIQEAHGPTSQFAVIHIDDSSTVAVSTTGFSMTGNPTPRGILALQRVLHEIRRHLNLFDQDS